MAQFNIDVSVTHESSGEVGSTQTDESINLTIEAETQEAAMAQVILLDNTYPQPEYRDPALYGRAE
jgi:hypothetical protein